MISSNTENLYIKVILYVRAKEQYYFLCMIEAQNRPSASELGADLDESVHGFSSVSSIWKKGLLCHHVLKKKHNWLLRSYF